MEKRTYVYAFIITFLLVASVSSLYLVFSSGDKLPVSPEEIQYLEECKVASYSGEEAINLVFFSSKEDAEEYSNFLLKAEPFNELQDNFNIFYIDDYNVENDCEIYKGIALLCNSRNLKKKAASCPHDYVIVLQKKPGSIRSSAYEGVMSLNSAHPKTVFLHEFGHVFANFAEEYVAEGVKIPRGSRNCVADCEEFGEFKDGCYVGCTKADHFRSVNEGVMRTLSSSRYGLFNENVIRERVEEELSSLLTKIGEGLSVITGNVVTEEIDDSCKNKEFYLGEFEYGEGGLELVDEEVAQGCSGGNSYGEFEYNLLGDDGLILKKKIDPLTFYAEGPGEEMEGLIQIEGEIVENPFNSVVILAPVVPEVRTLEIVDEEERVVQINLRGAGGRPCEL